MSRFAGRTVLVTGSTGIAAAAARALAAERANVFVVSRNQEHVDELVGSLGSSAAGQSADLTQEAEVESVVSAVVGRFEKVDCVYNVAGMSARRFGDGPLHEMSIEGWRAAMDNNATSQFLVCRAAVRQMLTQDADPSGRRGVILNMSSVLARHPQNDYFATHGYAAAKAAIEGFSRSAAAYYAHRGIRINVIAPALVATPMSARAQSDDRIMEVVARKQPLIGRALTPDDLVGTALYLLSDDSSAVSGQVVDVDAGWGISGAS